MITKNQKQIKSWMRRVCFALQNDILGGLFVPFVVEIKRLIKVPYENPNGLDEAMQAEPYRG
jgi:hypothetical protein